MSSSKLPDRSAAVSDEAGRLESTTVGIDIETVERWANPDPRLFVEGEHEYCQAKGNPAESYAGIWCAKEATVKAVWPRARLSPRDVVVSHDSSGRPSVSIGVAGAAIALEISISHTDDVAVAVAIAWPRATG